MKRNYLVPALGSLIGIGLLASGLLASASTPWNVELLDGEDAHPSNVVRNLTPLARKMKAKRVANPVNSVMPAQDGLTTIPGSLRARKAKPASIMRSIEAPRGHIYGIINRYAGMEFKYEAYLGEINSATGRVTPISTGAQFSPYIGDDYIYQGNSYRKGEVICPELDEFDTSAGGIGYRSIWSTYDINSGNYIATHIFEDARATPYTVAYNSDLDVFFVVAIDMVGSEGDGVFGIVKPNDNGEWTYLYGGKLETTDGAQPFIAAIAYNPTDKQLYAFDNRNKVYTIEWGENINFRPDPTLVEAGEIYMDDDSIIFQCDNNDPMAGQICYSPTDEAFIAIYRDMAAQKSRLAYIHPETFEGIVGPILTAPAEPYVTAIFCTDDFASSDAPMLAPLPDVAFKDADLSGQVTLKTPVESYIGLDITGSTVKAVTKIDGKVIDSRDVKAGDSFVLPLNLEQGQHTLEFTTAIGDNVSPVNTIVFYVGYDAPVPVKNLRLEGSKLSWDAPGAVGYHRGFVDTSDITYNVFIDNKLQNETPIKETSFNLNAPAEMKRYDLSVEAVSHGQSAPAASINQIFGQAMNLPFLQTPTKAQSVNYTVVNANKDSWAFSWGTNLGEYQGMTFQTGYMEDADDWLFLPLIHFPDSSKLYQFDVDIRGCYDMVTSESYEIWLATAPNPQGTITQIYSTPNHLAINNPAKHMKFCFAVPQEGDYYVAIHVTSTREQASQGMTFHNFEVKEVDGASSAVPGEPTNVSVVPAPFGEQAAIATATLPTVDILGKPLPADDDINLTFAFTDKSGYDYKVTKTGKPGETISIANDSDEDGFTVYTLTPSNKNGEGYTRSYRIYVGMDIPLHPDNIAGVPTDDNQGVTMTWDAPGNVGRNGGYVDTQASDFRYKFYTKSGISLQPIAETKETHYTFYPYGEGNKGSLATFYMGPSAINQAGESIESMFIREDLGTPFELPMLEEWNGTKFNYSPYTFFTSGEYSNSQWEGVSNTAALQIGNPILVMGGIYGYSLAGKTKGKVTFPKFTTQGIKKTIFKLRYWDYADAPKSLQIYARRQGNPEQELVGEFKLDNPSRGKWVDAELYLPAEYNDCKWVQLHVQTLFTGAISEYMLFDSFQVMDDSDFDLKITTFEGMSEATVGDDLSYNVTVANSGRERMDGKLRVEIIDEKGDVLAASNTDVDMLNSNQKFEYTAEFHLSFSNPNVKVRATIDADDENLTNNVKEIDLAIHPSAIPVVSDLQAVKHDETNSVDLSWSTPTTEYGNFENFESYKPFALTETFDYWQNINGDDLWPNAFQNQSTGEVAIWENSMEKRGWQIYDYDKLGFVNERLRPHSGKQALMAVCGGYGDGTPVQTSKWLVSPLVKPDTPVSFWYTTFESSNTEYVEIWTCDKANGELNPYDKNISLGRAGDFRKISSKSKAGDETWEFIKFNLSRREVKFALRYCSYDGYSAAIDDLSFTPAEMIQRTPESYSVFRCDKNGKNPVLIAENITDTHFTDNDWDGSECNYYVVANNTVDGQLVSGAASNMAYVAVSGVGQINDGQSVTAGKGTIYVNGFQGETVVIAAADGKIIVKTPVKASNAVYTADKGVYLVTLGKNTFKVIVK